jgi:hypothetical protein
MALISDGRRRRPPVVIIAMPIAIGSRREGNAAVLSWSSTILAVMPNCRR